MNRRQLIKGAWQGQRQGGGIAATLNASAPASASRQVAPHGYPRRAFADKRP
jgi:hypothetical protein